VRVVRGLPISWGQNFATAKHSDFVQTVAWSSCNRFIAVGLLESTEVLDAVTLERLHAFVHPESEARWLNFSPDGRSLTWFDDERSKSTTWDLQTGGRISATPLIPDTLPPYFSSAYSMDGKIAAFAYRDWRDGPTISTYNLISGTHIYSHRASEGWIIAPIWTHGEFLRFSTVKPGSITIWEVGFTSDHTLAGIKSLPAPDDAGSEEHLFLPTPSRLAFILDETVLIWGARDSKFLLNFVCGDGPQGLSFSSDGHFFACGVTRQGVHLWKESPTGYVLHQKLVSGLADGWITPFLLSPDGESIITFKDSETQLWRTTDPINPPSNVSTQHAEQTNFVLAFSPDKSFIATGRFGENIATIIDLKSGDPRLIINTGMEILNLGVTGSTAIVVGEGKIVTWNLPAGDCVLDVRANIHNSVRAIVFDHLPPPPEWLHSASISPDFNHLVITGWMGESLHIYDVSTGKHLVGTTTHHGSHSWFTRDGREVWNTHGGGQKIIRGGGSDVIRLEPLNWSARPSGGFHSESTHGHEITDDGWILDSRNKRVMWLPHHWRVSCIWDGRFLALFDSELPEPVIIEMYE